MPDTLSAWIAIILVAAVTIGSRISGPMVMTRFPMSQAVERFLQNLSLSVIAALVATMLACGGLREAAAVAVAAGMMVLTRKAIWSMGAGMACAATWTLLAT